MSSTHWHTRKPSNAQLGTQTVTPFAARPPRLPALTHRKRGERGGAGRGYVSSCSFKYTQSSMVGYNYYRLHVFYCAYNTMYMFKCCLYNTVSLCNAPRRSTFLPIDS